MNEGDVSRSGERASASEVAAFPVVGIGASAGGLEAFKDLLHALPADTGMAFILVVHLPATHESMLSEILARSSTLPVIEARDSLAIEPDHVYVLAAGTDADLREGKLVITPREAPAGMHHSIDHVLHSLAESVGPRAIGVVLSGSASDGTLGLQEIKAAGGITFAQDDTAQYASMPQSAIASGAVDFVLPPAGIARELARIAGHPLVAAAAIEPADDATDLDPVLAILRETSGVDFTHYKRNTLYRRIARRVVLHRLNSLADYVQMLKVDDDEAQALYQDILINVTSFFRDPAAYDELKAEVFAHITENRSRHDPVRFWVLACSTGEEAYSLAIAFAEFCDSLGRTLPLQVFATDVNDTSILKARLGVYPKSAVQGVSPERLRRFFVEVDGSYQITKSIRDHCVFARHNVLSDPPFSHVDLVSCRNLLIYLDADLQHKLIPVMHYALRRGGYLWLGTSETIGTHQDLFESRSPRHRIYLKKGGAARVPERPLPESRTMLPAHLGLRAVEPGFAPPHGQNDVDRILVARYAPPSVLIRSDLEILQFRGNTSRYVAPAPGRASLNLLKMVREELVMGVRAAVQAAKSLEMPARQEGLRLKIEDRECAVNVEVIPVRTGLQRAELFMVVFEDATQASSSPATARAPAAPGTDAAAREIERLQQELSATREYLQSVIEQQESANEALQAANEEVQSTNEELQSINEELETSKEEVQSSNEELATVNDELHARNNELAKSNSDFLNLLSSVQLAIVMIGADLRIRRFTPAAETLLKLRTSDIGRPLSDIRLDFDVADFDKLISESIDTAMPIEREVQDGRGCWHLLRIRPYRTFENAVMGAVIALIDIDKVKRSEETLRQQSELLNRAYEPIVMWELDGGVTYWNRAAEETYGYTSEQAIGRKPHELLEITPPFETYRAQLDRDGHWTGELVHTRRDGQKILVESRMAVVGDSQARKLVVEASRPIAGRQGAETVLRRLAAELVTADRHKDAFLAMLAHELRNPLAPLRNVVSLLKSPRLKPPEKARVLDVMDRQISNMARLLDDLLDVSRSTLSQIELCREQVDVAAAVRHVVEQNAPSLQARDQSVHLDLPQDPVMVDADPVRLEQIIGNLLDNASKCSNAGGEITIAVERTAAAEDGKSGRGQVVIHVRDNGVGIDPEKLPHVFDLFMRATRSIDRKYGGLGVGLTLVRRLTELHGGTVEALSAGLGAGSEFIVRLPEASAGPNSSSGPKSA